MDREGRYEDRFQLGMGGMGEVRLVYDRRLRRPAVMKIVRDDLRDSNAARRLAVEAQITARLQHPGVVPVYDAGTLPDGRPFYVMREVRGRTLQALIDRVWAGERDWSQRRLLEAFLRVCETLAYAHEQGVIHRDLKPENVMLEGFGSVLVLDWGIARLGGLPAESLGLGGEPRTVALDAAHGEAATIDDGSTFELPASSETPDLVSAGTQAGAVLGTAGYMAPEQARGAPVGPPADVYALGVTLAVILTGEAPARVRFGTPPVLGPGVPEPLAQLVARATAPSAAARPSAAGMAEELAAWLDGARRREQALGFVERADAIVPEIQALHEQARGLRTRAADALSPLAPSTPSNEKFGAWRLQDQADELAQQAVVCQEQWRLLLHNALELVPELLEAHERLADHYRERHDAAESEHDRVAATRAELRLRVHDRGRHRAWLDGVATLSIRTSPPAKATLYRYVLRDRRLVPELVGDLGVTPLDQVRVPWGSLMLSFSGPSGDVCYPLYVRRGEDWACVDPGGEERTFRLPCPLALGPDDCLVPAGWYTIGGDPHAADPLAAERHWTEAFIIRRFPVTNGEYLTFLNALAATGREAEALRRAPQRGDSVALGPGDVLFEYREGRFGIPATGPGSDWQPDEPVTLVLWDDANAYAEWLAAESGQPWRLPHEWEWEIAARGADARPLPWGDFLEPSWANTLDGGYQPARRASVHSFPTDESPFGVRGLVGNVRDWCGNSWERGRAGESDPAIVREAPFVVARGGSNGSSRTNCRPATRFGAPPDRRYMGVGFRVARRYEGDEISASTTVDTL